MGVDDVEALGEAAAQVDACAQERARTGRELVQLDVEAVEATQRADLVAHEAPALGVRGVGKHV